MTDEFTPLSEQTAQIHSCALGPCFYLPQSPLFSPSTHPPPHSSPGLLHTNQETSKRSISMLLGKRPRPPMKRTSSISEITFDLNTSMDVPPPDPNNPPNRQTPEDPPAAGKQPGGFNWLDQRALAPVSPRNHTRHSADFVETADFLRACSLCKRRLVPSRDIYMYKGDSAFCSLECRQQQMIQDERKEKYSLASNKQVVAPPSGSQVTTKGESVAAL